MAKGKKYYGEKAKKIRMDYKKGYEEQLIKTKILEWKVLCVIFGLISMYLMFQSGTKFFIYSFGIMGVLFSMVFAYLVMRYDLMEK